MGTWYTQNDILVCFLFAYVCFQVILLAESQGGQVASKLAPVVLPDLLVLLASLPDEPDITPLRNAHVQTVIGWKVGNHFSLIKFNISTCAGGRASLGGRDVAERVVRDLGPTAFMAGGRKGFPGRHSSFRHDEVADRFLCLVVVST